MNCRPYFCGWVLNKVTIWRERINRHILLIQQVNERLWISFQKNLLVWNWPKAKKEADGEVSEQRQYFWRWQIRSYATKAFHFAFCLAWCRNYCVNKCLHLRSFKQKIHSKEWINTRPLWKSTNRPLWIENN